MSADSLGDRMKVYERIEAARVLIPHLPIYARLDGRCFSLFTKRMRRPYDDRMVSGMIETTKRLVEGTHAILGYTQSDEISLAWHFPEPKSESLFGGKVQKLVSILAATATAEFNKLMALYIADNGGVALPVFDCRVFNLPSMDELANVFLWRELDATKNAISMAAHHFFSAAQLHGKSGSQKQEMLFQERRLNFNDYPAAFKRGTFVRRTTVERTLAPSELDRIPYAHRPTGPVIRSCVTEVDMPPLRSVTNRVGALFGSEDPSVA